ncbi:MAG: DNA repair protein RecN [Myxococcota bacterium]|nr:DNA repair protein RecN [Myxococcota bacterium]
MLVHLRILDFVLIDALDVSFSPGFNVVTGETGAGKSLISTAMDLLLGGRGRGDLVRRDAEKAEIEGLFDISDERDVNARLAEAGLPVDDELLIRRVIPAKGRHQCYINGRLASLGVLSSIAGGLAHAMGQHEHHSLMDPARQRQMLDGYGKLDPEVAKMGALFGQMVTADKALEDLRHREQDRAQRLDYLAFNLNEIDDIAPQDGEIETLSSEVTRLRNAEILKQAARQSALDLYEGDGAIYDRLGAVITKLEDAARYDSTLSGTTGQLVEAAALIEDTARGVSTYEAGIQMDAGRLAELEDRLESLKRLTRKHGTDVAGVLTLRKQLADEVEVLSQYESALARAADAVEKSRGAAEHQAGVLSKKRGRTAKVLARAVRKELADLAFGNAGFDVDLEPSASGIGRAGTDRVQFLVMLNPGEGVHPISKVASGGELSRLMLAIKRALAGVGPVGTYIFDEVDAGISGAVAASVGRKLKEVAAHHQVICITHLPQIAGMSDAHFLVSKQTKHRRTATHVRALDPAQRIEEIARMLGGITVTDKTRDAAKELIAGNG